jgi:hypothetical protein
VTVQLLSVVPAAALPTFVALRPALGAADLTPFTTACVPIETLSTPLLNLNGPLLKPH